MVQPKYNVSLAFARAILLAIKMLIQGSMVAVSFVSIANKTAAVLPSGYYAPPSTIFF